MEDKFKKFTEVTRMIALKPSEKMAIRKALMKEMTASHFSWAGLWRPVSVALGLVIVIGAGISSAAEGSLPGDLLYPVKISFNEGLRTKLASSPDAAAVWATARIDRRLVEAETLAVNNDLDSAKQDKIVALLKSAISTSGESPLSVKPELKATLKAHSRILENISVSLPNNESRDSLGNLSSLVQGEEAELAKDEVATSLAEESTVAKDKTSAEKRAREVIKLFESSKTNLNSERLSELNQRLQIIQKGLDDGEAKLKSGDLGQAQSSFQQSDNVAKETKILLRAKNSFEPAKSSDEDKPKAPEPKPNDTKSAPGLQTPKASVEVRPKLEINLGL